MSIERTTTETGVEGGRFNISRWALQHPDLTRYLMIVLMMLGLAAYFQLGQDEDPPFTFRAMVVQAYWPGASAHDMAEQVTDKIERTLQEVPYSDKIRSYTKPGESLTILQLADWSPGHEVPNTWYQARKKIGDMRATLPQGVIGPFFNDEFGDVYGSIYALSADGFSDEELRVRAEDIRSQLLRVHDVAKVELFGVQSQKIWVELSQRRAAEMGVDVNAVITQLNAQNAVQGSGVVDAGSQNVQVRVAGAFQSVDAIRALPIRVVNPATGQATSLRLGDIADVKRGYADPPDVKVRANGKQVVAIGISMAKGGDIIALGKGLQAQVAEVRRQLPVGMELTQVQGPAAGGEPLGGRVRARADRGHRDRAAGQLPEPGPALQPDPHRHLARPRGGDLDSAGAGNHLRHDVLLGRSGCTRSRWAR